MEGIAGVVYPDVFQNENFVLPMLNIMQHRGGPKQETHSFKNMQIGITGGTLVCNDNKSVYAAVNGNFYNKTTLCKELRLSSHNTPAELLIHAYELWGTACFSHLSGDFAVMLLDHSKDKLLLARDRIGKKPLYWYQDNHYFLFSSEMKGLIATNYVPQTPSLDAIASYLYFGYIPQDLTPIKGINKLLPGHYLQINSQGHVDIKQYWSYGACFKSETMDAQQTIVGHIDTLLTQAVRERVEGDHPLGCFISGGLGSACIAHKLSEIAPKGHIKGYTIGFQEHYQKDTHTAEAIANSLGIAHQMEWITPANFLDDLVPIAWHLDEPLADPHAVAIWKISKLSSQHTKQVFSGMGSDEILAGHSRYTKEEQFLPWHKKIMSQQRQWLSTLLLPLLNYVYPRGAFDLIKHARTNPWQFEYLKRNALFSERDLGVAAPKLAGLFDPEVFLHMFHNLHLIQSTISSFLYFDVKTRLADCFILEVERLTAAHGQSWTPPFLDHALVEYLAKVPETKKLSSHETALLLKGLLKDVYPPEILNNTKRSRHDFLSSWVVQSGAYDLFKQLSQGILVETGIISAAWIKAQVSTPVAAQAAYKQLWAILMLELWYRLYINHPIAMQAPRQTVRELLLEK